jgi:hypothetical protein
VGIDIKTTETIDLESYPGVKVELRTAVSMRDFRTMAVLGDLGGDMDAVEQAIETFGEKFIESWNVSVNGVDMEPSGESLAQLPVAIQMELVNRWLSLIGGPGGPLGNASSISPDSLAPSTAEPGAE